MCEFRVAFWGPSQFPNDLFGNTIPGINCDNVNVHCGKVFETEGESSFITSTLPDGRKVATGITCVMRNTDDPVLIGSKRSATLTNTIICGDPDDFPDVYLTERSDLKRRVPSGSVRSLSHTCPVPDTEILSAICVVGGRGSFRNLEETVDGNLLDCKYTNIAVARRSATMTNVMICGVPGNAPVKCGF